MTIILKWCQGKSRGRWYDGKTTTFAYCECSKHYEIKCWGLFLPSCATCSPVGFVRSVGDPLALYVLSVINMIDDKNQKLTLRVTNFFTLDTTLFPQPISFKKRQLPIHYQYDSNALHVSSSIFRRPCSGRQD